MYSMNDTDTAQNDTTTTDLDRLMMIAYSNGWRLKSQEVSNESQSSLESLRNLLTKLTTIGCLASFCKIGYVAI